MARRRFFVDGIHHGQAQVSGGQAHHLRNVLRVQAGQRYEISDSGRVFLAEVSLSTKSRVVFDVVEEVAAAPPPVRLTLFASLIKFERYELVIEKATELGVERIVPVIANRTVKGLDKAARKRVERWRKVAHEASQQSRRTVLPELAEAVHLHEILSVEADYRYFLDETEQARLLLPATPPEKRSDQTVALLTGPEGGWIDREREDAAAAGWIPVSLGRQVLRAETAALAALAVLVAAWQTGAD